MIAVSCAVLYYGWPVIEAILIMLPIPDPKVVKEKTVHYSMTAWYKLKSLFNKGAESYQGAAPSGYQKDFENAAPDTFLAGDDDEEDDNDMEDIGKKPFEETLNYDSDEKDSEGNKMINLEELPKPQKKKVPRLKKPSGV